MSSSWLLLLLFPLYLPFPRSFFFPLLLNFRFCHLSVCLWSKKLLEWQHRDWVALLVMQGFTPWRKLEAGYQMGRGGQGKTRTTLGLPTWTLCSKWCPYGDLTWEMLTGHCPILGRAFTHVSVCMVKESFLSIVDFGFESLDLGEMNFRSCCPRKP